MILYSISMAIIKKNMNVDKQQFLKEDIIKKRTKKDNMGLSKKINQLGLSIN